MALSLLQIGDKVAIGYNIDTGECGFLTKYKNVSGSSMPKGTVCTIATAALGDTGITLQSNEFDAIGIVADDAGIADDAESWVWKNGSLCQVLYDQNTVITR